MAPPLLKGLRAWFVLQKKKKKKQGKKNKQGNKQGNKNKTETAGDGSFKKWKKRKEKKCKNQDVDRLLHF